jgi:hypothetical protein
MQKCLTPYQVIHGYKGTPTQANPGDVDIVPGQSPCYDPPPGQDQCLEGGARTGCAKRGSSLRHFSPGGTVYRIMPPSEQGSDAAHISPKLTMRSAPFGTTVNDPSYPWTVLADNIEDMQIAVILTDGTVCMKDDSPATCNFANAAAVRVTLVGRSSSPIAGAPPTPQGGYEDEPTQPLPPLPDNLLRRSMTATIVLRNVAP